MDNTAEAMEPDSKKHSEKPAKIQQLAQRCIKKGMFQQIPENIQIKRATTKKELEEAYKLVHDVYSEKGYISPNRSGMRIRPWETLPETATYIATNKDTGEVIASHSTIPYTNEIGLPCSSVFGEEIEEIRDNGRRFPWEFTNWAEKPGHENLAVSSELQRICYAHSHLSGGTDLVAVVTPTYGRILSLMDFNVFGRGTYHGSGVSGIRLNLDNILKRYKKRDNEELLEMPFLSDFWILKNPYSHQNTLNGESQVYKIIQWQMQAQREFNNETRQWLLNEAGEQNKLSEQEIEKLRRLQMSEI